MKELRTVFCTLLLALSAAASAQGLLGPASNQDQFLPVDEAFVFTASADGGEQVVLDWQIAPGYY
ncbi:MAG: protein-disulfide reductase DsbD domain-containing protein, partial [Fimbriimonadaceae bacterium]